MGNVTNRSLGVVVSKPVRNRIEKKKICIRAEHVRHSSCRQDFLDRVKRNDTTRRECKKKGTPVPDLKRKPVGPRQAHLVRTDPLRIHRLILGRIEVYASRGKAAESRRPWIICRRIISPAVGYSNMKH